MSDQWLSRGEAGFEAALARNIQATKDKILSEEKTLSHVPRSRWLYIIRNQPRADETATMGVYFYNRDHAFAEIDVLETVQCIPTSRTTFDARVIDGVDHTLLSSLVEDVDLKDHEQELAAAGLLALQIQSPRCISSN